jgi:hypothetical protein
VDKKVVRKNKILAAMLAIIALGAVAGAILWFSIYAPIILK